MRLALVMATCLAVSGCAAAQSAIDDLIPDVPAAPSAKDDVAADIRSLVGEKYNYKTLVGYGWNGNTYANLAELNAAIDKAVAAEMANLPRMGSVESAIRILRPNPRSVATVPEIANLRLAEARIEALRQSGLFTALRVENIGPGKFVAKGGDFVMRYETVIWKLRDGEDRQIAIGNGADLSSFVAKVSGAVDTLRNDTTYLYVLHNVAGPKGGEMVSYRDQKYSDLVSLVDAFDRVNAELVGHVVPTTKPLGGRALLILPRHAPDISLLRPGENPGLIDSGRKAYRLALDKRFARFLQASKVFADVTSVFADEVGAVPVEYDWVLWREPNASVWSARSRDDDFGTLMLNTQPQGFATALTQALTPPPDPELDATEDPAGSMVDGLVPRIYER
ncbi:MAG: hypothetical protein AB7G62_11685 [Magnetospirillum sp.]